MDVKRVENFFELIQDTDIRELCWERNGIKLRIKRSIPNTSTSDIHILETKEEIESTNEDSQKEIITSKFVGSFFSYGNGKKLELKIGEIVKKGQILGYIEAMNIFKEIISDYDGVIHEIFAQDGISVEYGQKLFVIDLQ